MMFWFGFGIGVYVVIIAEFTALIIAAIKRGKKK